eukprot:m.50379 g.50379  ORF g.50379 m.50379 type:complete len:74 (+) comp34067_c0_seq12:1511-1732(+)
MFHHLQQTIYNLERDPFHLSRPLWFCRKKLAAVTFWEFCKTVYFSQPGSKKEFVHLAAGAAGGTKITSATAQS